MPRRAIVVLRKCYYFDFDWITSLQPSQGDSQPPGNGGHAGVLDVVGPLLGPSEVRPPRS